MSSCREGLVELCFVQFLFSIGSHGRAYKNVSLFYVPFYYINKSSLKTLLTRYFSRDISNFSSIFCIYYLKILSTSTHIKFETYRIIRHTQCGLVSFNFIFVKKKLLSIVLVIYPLCITPINNFM